MAIDLNDELKGVINGALEAGTPMIVATVDAEGRPRMSFRGSIQTFSDDQLGFWARNREGSTLESIGGNPHVAMMYRSPATRVVLQLAGRARIATDPAEIAQVYESAPEFERKVDPERKGTGVIVDLDKVEGFLGVAADGTRRFVRMARDS